MATGPQWPRQPDPPFVRASVVPPDRRPRPSLPHHCRCRSPSPTHRPPFFPCTCHRCGQAPSFPPPLLHFGVQSHCTPPSKNIPRGSTPDVEHLWPVPSAGARRPSLKIDKSPPPSPLHGESCRPMVMLQIEMRLTSLPLPRHCRSHPGSPPPTTLLPRRRPLPHLT
jgi:hypothetical protein